MHPAHLINDPAFYSYPEKEIDALCNDKMAEIRQDPQSYFEKNYRDMKAGDVYDRVGLFSCTTDPLNETMWAHYGGDSKGFVVGFNTVSLAKDLLCSAGPVKYSDEIPLYSFINPRLNNDFDSYYLKSKKWAYESEFRYCTIGDDHTVERLKKYSPESVLEFIIGEKFPETDKSEFISVVRELYGSKIKIYQAKSKVSGYGFEKNRIY